MLAFAETKMDTTVKKMLQDFDWKGNTRELLNVLEQAISRVEGNVIRPADLPFYLHRCQKTQNNGGVSTLKQAQIQAEKAIIRKALVQTSYNKAQAARLLGIHRTLLYKKANKYAISLTPPKNV